MIKDKFLKMIKMISIIFVLFLVILNSYVYASAPKWSVYPEWGLMLKISFISVWIAIPITLIGIIVKFISDKLKKENHIINKLINKTILILFFIAIISRVLVEFDINNHAVTYFIIATFICIILILLLKNFKPLTNKILYIIILFILIIFLLINDNVYPYSADHYLDPVPDIDRINVFY